MILLKDKQNVVAPAAPFIYGDIKDDTGLNDGTLLDRATHSDIHQFFEKMFADSGRTATGVLDNATNGWQLWDALNDAIAKGAPGYAKGAWVNAGTPSIITSNAPAGTITIDPGDILYNRYRLVGKTLQWQIKLTNVTIGGSAPTSLILNPPIAFTSYINQGMRLPAFYNGALTAYIDLSGVSGPGQCQLKLISGGSFTLGTNNQSFDINIIAEIS